MAMSTNINEIGHSGDSAYYSIGGREHTDGMEMTHMTAVGNTDLRTSRSSAYEIVTSGPEVRQNDDCVYTCRRKENELVVKIKNNSNKVYTDLLPNQVTVASVYGALQTYLKQPYDNSEENASASSAYVKFQGASTAKPLEEDELVTSDSSAYVDVSGVPRSPTDIRQENGFHKAGYDYAYNSRSPEMTLKMLPIPGSDKDQYGYLKLLPDKVCVLCDQGKRKEKQIYVSVDKLKQPAIDDHRNTTSASLPIKILIPVLVIVALGAATVSVLLYKGILPSSSTEAIKGSDTKLNCTTAVAMSVGRSGHLHCELKTHLERGRVSVSLSSNAIFKQDFMLSYGHIEDGNFTGIYRNRIQTESTLLEGYLSLDIRFYPVFCSDHGVLTVNLDEHLILRFRVNVIGDMVDCPDLTKLTWNTVETLTCCFCVGEIPFNASWMYDKEYLQDNATGTETPRISSVESTDHGALKTNLTFSNVYCFDGGKYDIMLHSHFGEYVHSITASVEGFPESCPTIIQPALTTQRTVICNLCSEKPANITSFNVTHVDLENNVTTLLGSVGDNQTTAVEERITVSVQKIAGVIITEIHFQKTQCEDEGTYVIQAITGDSKVTKETRLYFPETIWLIDPKISQPEQEGGFVEGYNLTLSCTAVVGCRKWPLEVTLQDRNMTLQYFPWDINKDNISDGFNAQVVWYEVNISTAINNTIFQCGFTHRDEYGVETNYTTSEHIIVIPHDFCDGRRKNCFYEHPYFCGKFISCLEDSRPRVKRCSPSDYHFRPYADNCGGECIAPYCNS